MDFKVNCQAHLSTFVNDETLTRTTGSNRKKVSKISSRKIYLLRSKSKKKRIDLIFPYEEDKRMAVTIGWRIKKKKKDNSGKN